MAEKQSCLDKKRKQTGQERHLLDASDFILADVGKDFIRHRNYGELAPLPKQRD